ncbi:MAG: DUF4348 domain-containing protein [Bacteroidaceae bacterium]|nr:DUF4348 domain-containing protein [Bacteroidaceae bacterium]
MSIKCKVIGFAVTVAAILSCGGSEQGTGNKEHEAEYEETEPADTLVQEKEELSLSQEESPALDGVFNDFLFAYLHSRTLRRERTVKPLRLEHTTRPAEMLEEFDPDFEFGFLSGEYFTTLYGSTSQMLEEDEEESEEDTIVSLQRINLNDGTIRNFHFLREQGHWQLDAIREATFEDDDLGDFLSFYAQFCNDSIFQTQSIANPLHIAIQDPEDGDGSINGIIDANQWQTFCPEVPGGIISNIRKGQSYGGQKIVLRKSGLSNGLQEVFTFTKERGTWRLTRYEN